MAKLRHALLLSSSTYKNHVLEGFAQLQQNDEFVDMTLAADGHWVKVHRTLVALSSPYFRDLLRSVPSPHPVIYLNGVSNEALGFILEYMYTGQAEIPAGKIKTFLTTAQDLQIAGLKNIIPPDENETPSQDRNCEHIPHESRLHNEDTYALQPQDPMIGVSQPLIEHNINDPGIPSNIDVPMSSEETNEFQEDINVFQNVRNVNTPGKTINITLNENASTENNGQNPVAKIEILSNIVINESSGMAIDQLPVSYTKALVNLNNEDMSNQRTNIYMDGSANTQEFSQISNNGDSIPMTEDMNASHLQDCDNIATQNTLTPIINLDNREQQCEIVKQDSVLYTVSNRGAVQLILDHFMYYCHYQRGNGRRRRWRCIDYRDAHCPASIDTVGEQIVERKHKHCHPNHDEKIKKKILKINVRCFPSIELAEAVTKQQGSGKKVDL